MKDEFPWKVGRLRILPSKDEDRPGFLIVGRDRWDRSVKVRAQTHEGAIQIKRVYYFHHNETEAMDAVNKLLLAGK